MGLNTNGIIFMIISVCNRIRVQKLRKLSLQLQLNYDYLKKCSQSHIQSNTIAITIFPALEAAKAAQQLHYSAPQFYHYTQAGKRRHQVLLKQLVHSEVGSFMLELLWVKIFCGKIFCGRIFVFQDSSLTSSSLVT